MKNFISVCEKTNAKNANKLTGTKQAQKTLQDGEECVTVYKLRNFGNFSAGQTKILEFAGEVLISFACTEVYSYCGSKGINFNGGHTRYCGVLSYSGVEVNIYGWDSTDLKQFDFLKGLKKIEKESSNDSNKISLSSTTANLPTTTREALKRAYNYTESLNTDIDALDIRLRKIGVKLNTATLKDAVTVNIRKHSAYLLKLGKEKQRAEHKAAVIENDKKTVAKVSQNTYNSIAREALRKQYEVAKAAGMDEAILKQVFAEIL